MHLMNIIIVDSNQHVPSKLNKYQLHHKLFNNHLQQKDGILITFYDETPTIWKKKSNFLVDSKQENLISMAYFF